MLQNSALSEQPFFFAANGYRVFAVMHYPKRDVPRGVFVFCHPFAEEKLWSHRVYVNFARELARRGFAALRLDYMGHGDSDGQFFDSDVDSELADIRAAIAYARAEFTGIEVCGLFGLRLGASLAAVVADQDPAINKLILWDPIIDGERYVSEMFRSNLATQMAAYGKIVEPRELLIEKLMRGEGFNIDGYDMSKAMYEGLQKLTLANVAHRFSGDVLIVQIGKPGQPIKREMQALAESYAHPTTVTAVEEPFWREIRTFYSRAENLFSPSLEWLDKATAHV
ncbi:MAG: serine aminopeptidase domain-containing protein [Chromatocurvus sp.]